MNQYTFFASFFVPIQVLAGSPIVRPFLRTSRWSSFIPPSAGDVRFDACQPIKEFMRCVLCQHNLDGFLSLDV